MYVVLGAATLLKLVCWAVCAALQAKSDSMLALAEVCVRCCSVVAGAHSRGCGDVLRQQHPSTDHTHCQTPVTRSCLPTVTPTHSPTRHT
jgi:hypothetical protein